jgi:hypothetical protein
MNIFFDVDYTILGQDFSLRPFTHDVFTRLGEDGHDVYVWSGEGERWEVVRKHELEHLVKGVYGKPLQDYHRRLPEFGIEVVPDFVIDDYPGIVRAFGGICIPDYINRLDGANDRELERVYEVIVAQVAGATPEHPRYYPRPDVPSRD